MNLQQIPSHSKDVRLMFSGSIEYYNKDMLDNVVEINEYEEVETTKGYVAVEELNVGDILKCEEEYGVIKCIEKYCNTYKLTVNDMEKLI